MILQKEFVLQGSKGKPILLDVTFDDEIKKPLPTVIFCHGFKGFKDWGTFNFIDQYFAKQGFCFAKFNFSHNGTSLSCPTDFVDVEAFGNNNFLFELQETKSVINFLLKHDFKNFEIDTNNLSIIGHSRGGGTAILAGAQHEAIKKIIGWAPVHEFLKYWDATTLEKIKRDGVLWIENSRTQQRLPMYYQYWENYEQHLAMLHIPSFVKKLQKPLLVIHGKNDEALDYHHSEEIKSWNPAFVELQLYNELNHTFGGKHPYIAEHLPAATLQIVGATITFLEK